MDRAIPYTAPYPASIGYHPGRNALIAIATDSTGQITGGQFIHLDRDGHKLAKAEAHARGTRPTDPTFPRAEDACLISWTLELSANYGSFLEANI
jgi:hypothetical protein